MKNETYTASEVVRLKRRILSDFNKLSSKEIPGSNSFKKMIISMCIHIVEERFSENWPEE